MQGGKRQGEQQGRRGEGEWGGRMREREGGGEGKPTLGGSGGELGFQSLSSRSRFPSVAVSHPVLHSPPHPTPLLGLPKIQ
jgi:hypothetical protein